MRLVSRSAVPSCSFDLGIIVSRCSGIILFFIALVFAPATMSAQQESATRDTAQQATIILAQSTVPRSSPTTNPNTSLIGDFRASYISPAHRHIDAEFHEEKK